jgi:hypothetical protein
MILPAPHFTGGILAGIARAVNSDRTVEATIDQRQSNALHGIHQARVTIEGDPRPYRLILAPANAPIGLPHGGDRCDPIDRHFAEALS